MSDQPAAPGTDDLLKLRAEYWSKRLDHTLTHTQTSSRLIYLVDGAVLALVYFAIPVFGGTRLGVALASLPVGVLAGLNGMHALLIRRQHWWYHHIDEELAKLLTVPRIARPPTKPRWLHSTHGIYQGMHWLIAGFLAVLALCMVAYGLGAFPEIVFRGANSTAG